EMSFTPPLPSVFATTATMSSAPKFHSRMAASMPAVSCTCSMGTLHTTNGMAFLSSTGLANRPGEVVHGKRQLGDFHTKRMQGTRHGVRHGAANRHDAAFAGAFRAQRIERGGPIFQGQRLDAREI